MYWKIFWWKQCWYNERKWSKGMQGNFWKLGSWERCKSCRWMKVKNWAGYGPDKGQGTIGRRINILWRETSDWGFLNSSTKEIWKIPNFSNIIRWLPLRQSGGRTIKKVTLGDNLKINSNDLFCSIIIVGRNSPLNRNFNSKPHRTTVINLSKFWTIHTFLVWFFLH